MNNIIHGFSDLILAGVGLYVFFRYINRLNFSTTILWESFILSVVVSAFFGALGFFGLDKAIDVSRFFQKLATLNGSVGLAGAAFALASGKDFLRYASYALIALGFVVFALAEVFDFYPLYFWVPTIAMILVLLFGLWALIQNKTKIGIWLIVGVLFFALGVFRKEIFGDSDFSIDLYHLLMAAGVLSIGMANMNVKLNSAVE